MWWLFDPSSVSRLFWQDISGDVVCIDNKEASLRGKLWESLSKGWFYLWWQVHSTKRQLLLIESTVFFRSNNGLLIMKRLAFYCLACHFGTVHCRCGLQILVLNGSGLQIQTNGTAWSIRWIGMGRTWNIRWLGESTKSYSVINCLSNPPNAGWWPLLLCVSGVAAIPWS